MNTLDCVEIWSLSLQNLFESVGVTADFRRGPEDRPNPSCSLNLRRGELETDLLVWESGAAELLSNISGAVEQRHFVDVRTARELAAALSGALRVIHAPRQ